MSKKFGRLEFYLQANDNCCGLFDVGGFSQKYAGMFYHGDTFTTQEEVFRDFERRLIEDVAEFTNEDSHYKGGYLLQATLIDIQSEIANWFELTGWEKKSQFTNSNTGNTVSHYTRVVTQQELAPLWDEEEAHEEW